MVNITWNDAMAMAQWLSRKEGRRYRLPPGLASGSVRLRRGGSWHTWSLYARSTFRNWNTPQTRYTLVGMRLLLEAEDSR